ncbi:MAG: hypothetical protein ACRCXD_01410 [Luteolibacter sp.]
MNRTRRTTGQPAYISTLSDAQVIGIMHSLQAVEKAQGCLSSEQTERLAHYTREHGRRLRQYRKQGVMP